MFGRWDFCCKFIRTSTGQSHNFSGGMLHCPTCNSIRLCTRLSNPAILIRWFHTRDLPCTIDSVLWKCCSQILHAMKRVSCFFKRFVTLCLKAIKVGFILWGKPLYLMRFVTVIYCELKSILPWWIPSCFDHGFLSCHRISFLLLPILPLLRLIRRPKK